MNPRNIYTTTGYVMLSSDLGWRCFCAVEEDFINLRIRERRRCRISANPSTFLSLPPQFCPLIHKAHDRRRDGLCKLPTLYHQQHACQSPPGNPDSDTVSANGFGLKIDAVKVLCKEWEENIWNCPTKDWCQACDGYNCYILSWQFPEYVADN